MKPSPTWKLLGLVSVLFALSLFIGWLVAEAKRLSLAEADRLDIELGMMFLQFMDMAISLWSLFAVTAGVVLVCIRKTRFVGMCLVLSAAGYLGGCGSRRTMFGDPRKEAWAQVGERMMPLVTAIEAYHRDNGAYPERVELLVPKYLNQLPSTGMGRHTNYYYRVAPRTLEGNPWTIEVPAGYGMGFDQFYYFPLQNYPHGWPYERIGKWAYFHE